MKHRIVRAASGALRKSAARLDQPYVRVFALLIASVVLLVGLSALSWCIGCGCSCSSSCDTTQVEEEGKPDNPPQASIYGLFDWNLPLQPGDRTFHNLRGWGGGDNPGSLDLAYTPPPGATNLVFEGRQPDEQRPDGTCVWHNVPTEQGEGGVGWRTPAILVWFSAPSPPAGETSFRTTAILTVTHPDGQTATVSRVNTVGTMPFAASALPDTTPSWKAPPADADSEPDKYYLWCVHTWHDVHDEPLTTAICQEWADLLPQTDAFIGVQFPLVNATPPYTGSYSLPVAFWGNYRPAVKVLDISDFSNTEMVTIPLEYKHEYETFLTSVMPWEEDKRWFALGVDTDAPIVCPPGLDLGPDEWTIRTDAWLDFGGAYGACADCVLPVYYCYKGQELPEIPGLASEILGLSVASYQGWGITCAGPHLLRLAAVGTANPPFAFEGVQGVAALPTERVTYTLMLANLGNSAVDLTLAATSTVGGVWSFYGADDPPAPLSMPVHLTERSGSGSYLEFHVASEVPSGAAGGGQVVYITATDTAEPTRRAEITALLWVGEWEPPSPFRIYLPLAMRQ